MKLIDLIERVSETTGIEIATSESLKAAIANCYADLTSRGYRKFKEQVYDLNTIKYFKDLAVVPKPLRIRKILYSKVFYNNKMINAHRVSLANPNLLASKTDYGFRTRLGPNEVIFYSKDDTITYEYNGNNLGDPIEIRLGYYESLQAPKFGIEDADIDEIEIDIKEEFESVIVAYCVYFYYSRTLKDQERIVQSLNCYKYLVEDLLHELQHEDSYNEDDVIRVEE